MCASFKMLPHFLLANGNFPLSILSQYMRRGDGVFVEQKHYLMFVKLEWNIKCIFIAVHFENEEKLPFPLI
jgi:hypothetical protein